MITSFRNPLVKRIKRLRRRRYRSKEGVFFIEGIRVVLTAIEAGARIETILYSSELLNSEVARVALSQQQDSGLKCVELSAPVFHSVSERDHPVGFAAIVESDLRDIGSLSIKATDILVALIGVKEPGNLGTIIRTIDAVGGSGLLLVGQTVDPFHPTAVKASMGGIFTVPIVSIPDLDILIEWAEHQGLNTVATSARATKTFREATYKSPLLLMLGSEKLGLPPQVLEAAGQSVSIPMAGTSTSLNLAVAAGIILYEIQRMSHPMD